MIEEVQLSQYRGFQKFRAELSPDAFLVGPVAVETQDLRAFRALAQACGAPGLASERDVTLIPLRPPAGLRRSMWNGPETAA